MRIALCLYGEPRDIDKSYPMYKQHLIDPNGIEDVFCHLWHNNQDIGKLYNETRTDGSHLRKDGIRTGELIVPNLFVRAETPSLVYQLYNPKICQIEQKYIWKAEDFGRPEYTCQDVIPATQSMLYSVASVFGLMQSYETQMKFKYDAVIMCRPDLILKEDIAYHNRNLNVFHCINECSHVGGINYWFGLSNRDNMMKYASLFYNMRTVFNQGHKFIPEIIVGQWLDMNQIPISTNIRSYGVLR